MRLSMLNRMSYMKYEFPPVGPALTPGSHTILIVCDPQILIKVGLTNAQESQIELPNWVPIWCFYQQLYEKVPPFIHV